MFKTGALRSMKLNTKGLLPTIDLYSSNMERPSAPDQDPIVLGMSKHRTKRQCLLQGVTSCVLQPSSDNHHYLANCWH